MPDNDNPYWPFDPTISELEEINYKNAMLEIICDRIMNYNGNGVCGSDKLQHIKEVYLAAQSNPATFKPFNS